MFQYLRELTLWWRTTEPGQWPLENAFGNHIFYDCIKDHRSAQVCIIR